MRSFNQTLLTTFAVGLLILLAVSCVTVPKEEIEIYRYAIEPAREFIPADTVLPLRIKVVPFTTDALYRGGRIIYSTSGRRTDHYYYHRWLAPAEAQLTDIVANNLLGWGIFGKGVMTADNGLIPTHELSCRLTKLLAVNIRKEYAAVMELDCIFSAIDPKTYDKSLIFQKKYTLSHSRTDDNINSFIAGVDSLTADWLLKLRLDLLPYLLDEAEKYPR